MAGTIKEYLIPSPQDTHAALEWAQNNCPTPAPPSAARGYKAAINAKERGVTTPTQEDILKLTQLDEF